MTALLPDLPGKIQGIVGRETNEQGREVYVLQCQECGGLERPWPLVTMSFKFCPVHDKARGHDRLCPPCRITSLTAQGYSRTGAEAIVADGFLR